MDLRGRAKHVQMPLVAEIYIDEGVAIAVVPLLRVRGHAVIHARAHRSGAKDDVQLLTAAQGGWLFVTNNGGDFRLLHDAWHHWPLVWAVAPPPQHAGILVVGNRWLADAIADRVHAFVRGHQQSVNRLYLWVDRNGWEERSPTPM